MPGKREISTLASLALSRTSGPGPSSQCNPLPRPAPDSRDLAVLNEENLRLEEEWVGIDDEAGEIKAERQ